MIGRLVKLTVVVAIAAVAAGIWLGATRLAWGPAPLKTVDATATYTKGVGRASTDGNDQQFVFDVHRIPWASGAKVGKGDPPCLRTPDTKVKVEIGYRSIRLPDGRTSADVPLWLKCR
jgi:hypothetical protein